MKRLFKAFFGLAVFSALVLAAAALVLPRGFLTKGTVVALIDPAKVAFDSKKSLNILLLGVDYNYDGKAQRHTSGARSDTILILRVEPLGKHLSMLSLPRDLYVGIGKNAEYGYDRINAAYSFGTEKLAIETIQRVTGLTIDHHVVVKSDVVAKLVDSVGGVPVTVEKQMDWDDNWAGLHIHLKPGPQRLSGSQAVGFCRFRQDEDGDFGRIKRQQQFIGALIKELKRPKNLLKIDDFAEIILTEMKTDLTQDQLVALASLYKSFPLDNIQKGRPEVEDYDAGGAAVLILAPGEPAACIRKVFTELPDPTVKDVGVVIETGPKRTLEANQLASSLKQRGFPSIRLVLLAHDFEGENSLKASNLSAKELSVVRDVFGALKVEHEKSKTGPPLVTLRLARPVSIYN